MTYSCLRRKTPLRAKKPLVSRVKDNGGQSFCKSKKKPTEGKETAKKQKNHAKGNLVEHLDRVFSLFIRLRDAMPSGMVKCISCGRLFPFEAIQCGHYHSRRSMATRWDERNCNAECAVDNCSNPNHLEGYRVNLITRIGEAQFEELNVLAHKVKKWDDGELKEMIRHYTAEVRKLSREKGIKVNI